MKKEGEKKEDGGYVWINDGRVSGDVRVNINGFQ